MFFNSHSFVASRIYKSNDSLLLIGSIIPDIAITKIINWSEGLHGKKNSSNFADFIKNKYPSLTELAKGITAHNFLDELSHEGYKGDIGYAFQNNDKLVKKVKKYYAIDESLAAKIAHNYIESAVDILLVKKDPSVYLDLKQAIKDIDTKLLAKSLAEFFEGDEMRFRSGLKLYFDLISENNLENINGWVYLWKELGKFLNLKNPSSAQIRKLLNISVKIVKLSYEEFLNFASSAF